MKSGIYNIVNTNNGKTYVGSSHDLQRRWRRHQNDLNGNKHPNAKLQAGWNAHGPSAFEFVVLELVEKDAVLEREQHWIDALSPFYNICLVAGNTAGVTPSDEARMKMSAAKRGKARSPEAVEKTAAAHRNKIVSAETRAKLAAIQRGSKRSPETRAAMSRAAQARAPRSEEVKAQVSASLREFYARRKAACC